MIEFYGSHSEKCIAETEKRKRKNLAVVFAVAIVLFGIIPTTILGIIKNSEFYHFLFLTILLTISLLLAIFVPPRAIVFRLPRRIEIENGYISQEVEGLRKGFQPKKRPISKVKKVIDAGEWYYIIFRFGDITNAWICQKNLIIKGTIEEFEKLFDSKIVKSLTK